MKPWDFGIINSLKRQFEEHGLPINFFPAPLPEDIAIDEPRISVAIENVKNSLDQSAVASITLSLDNGNSNKNLFIDVVRIINVISQRVLRLMVGKMHVGTASLKINSVESKHNKLSISLNSLITLRRIYHDA